MKINMGCGIHRIEGYVNVDSVPGDAVDVVGDIRSPPFDPCTADKIVSIHALEHINYWDVKPTLMAWFRILKPGGRVIIECPDIIKCCVNLLQILTTKDQDLLYAAGLAGIYGDPGHKRDEMTHKWGWTAVTLAPILERVGFTGIKHEPAQLHKREIRDFRISATKPP